MPVFLLWFRIDALVKSLKIPYFCHSRENGNPVISISYMLSEFPPTREMTTFDESVREFTQPLQLYCPHIRRPGYHKLKILVLEVALTPLRRVAGPVTVTVTCCVPEMVP